MKKYYIEFDGKIYNTEEKEPSLPLHLMAGRFDTPMEVNEYTNSVVINMG